LPHIKQLEVISKGFWLRSLAEPIIIKASVIADNYLQMCAEQTPETSVDINAWTMFNITAM
jgi:hypothetical protein